MTKEFLKHVRDALLHLYDTVYLQEHPLAAAVGVAVASGSAQALRRVLLEMIEELRPDGQLPYSAKEWRPYRILSERYVQQTPLFDILRELAISDRQYQREHARSLYALAGLLWQLKQQREAAMDREATAQEADVSAEVRRFVAGAQREALDGEQLVRGALDAVEKLAASRDIAIEVRCAANLPPVYGDRGLLRQMVLNLLSHLLGSGKHQALRITIECVADELWVTLELSDARVAMEQAPEDDSGRLDMSSHLAQAAGGQLEISGTTIRLRLPLQRRVLLVVDDNQDIIELFSRYLADGAFRVVGAFTADQALALAREIRPFLITLDVMMPTHDGWEALQSLKHNPATFDIPVAICSILHEPDLAYSLGADDYIKKPVTQNELLALLARWEQHAQRPAA